MIKKILEARDGYKLNIHVFEVKEAKAAVQVIHGMEEHQERYEHLAKFLNKNGYSVVTSNMRGHGDDAPCLGFFKDKKGYKELIHDQRLITKYVKEIYPELPIYIFAHSMGTIITRVLLQSSSHDYTKVILSGYPRYQGGAGFGIILTNIIKTFRGAKYKSKFIENMSVGVFNKAIKNPKTPIDWVCKNEEDVKAYFKDPYCGHGFTISAFNDLFHLVKLMHKPSRYQNVNTKMPLLLLRGLEDPCVGGNDGALDSYTVLAQAGFVNIQSIAYPDMRHEIINEKEYQKVFNDIIYFLKKE